MCAAAATIHRQGWPLLMLLWIAMTTACVTVAALIGWQLRVLIPGESLPAQRIVSFVVGLETALIVSAGQWLVLRRYSQKVNWWIPASLLASVAASQIIAPLVFFLASASGVLPPVGADLVLVLAVLSSATSGIVLGAAQAFVLRRAAGMAWTWIPACGLGVTLGIAVANALSFPLLDASASVYFPIVAVIISLSAVDGFLASACQAPVLVWLLKWHPSA